MIKAYKTVFQTPPLWTNEQFGLKQFIFPEISIDTFIPKEIPPNLRLGHQIEYIFGELIGQSSSYSILAHSLQIKRGNTTIGEFDFILQHIASKRFMHIELTYKFYIIDPDISEPIHRLAGPNKRDMFFTKLDKIKEHQFPLAQTSEGRQALQDLGIPLDDLEQECCFLAQLFIPYHKTLPSIRPLNTACIAGFWIRMEDFDMEAFKSNEYYIPHKSEWLDTPHQDVSWQSHFNILMDITIYHLKNRSPLLWIRDTQGAFKKFFVVFF